MNRASGFLSEQDRPTAQPPEPTVVTTRTLPCRGTSVADAREEVRRAGRNAGLSADRCDDLVVATSEMVTNAFDAHERGGRTDPVHLECLVTATGIEVVVVDHGGGFDPEAIPPRPPAGDPAHLEVERGWGIQIMHALCDLVVFEPHDDGTKARLVMTVEQSDPGLG